MSQAQHELLKNEHLRRARILKGVALKAEAVDPFQYYSELGESIYCVYLPNQSGLTIHYLHFDAYANAIASLVSSETPSSLNVRNDISIEELEDGSPEEVDFVDLLRDMHLVATKQMGDLYKSDELDRIVNAFPEKPIIIGGCGRSGTTLLLSILGAHSEIFAIADELYPFYPYPFRLRRLSRTLESVQTKRAKRWCEKTPKNVRAFGAISDAFGERAKLVHIVRDGRDVVTSHHPNHVERYWVSPERWVADVSAGLERRSKTYLVKYEDLVSEPENAIRKLCEFIQIEFEIEMLEPQKNSRIKENVAWDGRKLQELNTSAVGKWQAREHQNRVQEFLDYPEVVPVMRELGYL